MKELEQLIVKMGVAANSRSNKSIGDANVLLSLLAQGMLILLRKELIARKEDEAREKLFKSPERECQHQFGHGSPTCIICNKPNQGEN